MKVFFDKIFQLSEGFQEILIDENEYERAAYNVVSKTKQSINGIVYEDVFVLQPLSYFEVKLRKNTPHSFNTFQPSFRMLQAGLIISDINRDHMSVFIYNSTQNYVYIRENAIIGEIL